jgi:hypothetical protein
VIKPVNLPDTPKNFSNIVPLEAIADKNAHVTKNSEFNSTTLFAYLNNKSLLNASKVIKTKLKQISNINLGIFIGSYEVSGVIAKVMNISAIPMIFMITCLLLVTNLL